MADISVENDVLRIKLTIAERLLGLRRGAIEIPTAQVAGIVAVPAAVAQLRGLRVPGTGLPGLLAIGTWRGRSGGQKFRDFAVIHRRGPGVVITTDGGEYDRIVLTTDEPDRLVAAVPA